MNDPASCFTGKTEAIRRKPPHQTPTSLSAHQPSWASFLCFSPLSGCLECTPKTTSSTWATALGASCPLLPHIQQVLFVSPTASVSSPFCWLFSSTHNHAAILPILNTHMRAHTHTHTLRKQSNFSKSFPDWHSELLFSLSPSLFLSLSFYKICLFSPVLGLPCYIQTFSSCGEWGLLSSCGERASHCVGSSVAEHRL